MPGASVRPSHKPNAPATEKPNTTTTTVEIQQKFDFAGETITLVSLKNGR
jgi:hypothetical protein